MKWTEERSENYLATIHGRDVRQEIELAASEDGKITAVRARLRPPWAPTSSSSRRGRRSSAPGSTAGCYDIEAYDFECVGVFTTTTPTDAYRGAGRPEATYAIERAVDALARKLEMDPVELRRKNFITEFPAAIASGLEIDSGDFDGALDRALEMVDYDGLRREQAERRARGDTKELGIGFSTYTEMCGLAPSRILGAIRYAAGGWDAATIRCLPTGTVQVFIGTSPHGQGHVTTFSQIVADRLGVPIENVEVVHGDTTAMQLGLDTYGSRSLAVGGVALYNAAEKVIAKARKIVAHKLEVAADDLEYEGGRLHGQGHRQVDDRHGRCPVRLHRPQPARRDGAGPRGDVRLRPAQLQLAGRLRTSRRRGRHRDGRGRPAPLRRRRRGRHRHQPDDRGRPGARRHRAGHRAGALRGGDLRRDGNLTTGSMLSYLVPRAAEMIDFELDRVTEPRARRTRMGVKGVGETGTIASTAAVINAIVDALSPYGVTDVEMPAKPETVWRAIQEGRCEVIPASFDYEVAESVDHAIELLGSGRDAKLLAGGHSLLPLMRLRLARPELLVDIGRLSDLSYVREDGDAIAIGALTRYHDLERDELLRAECPILAADGRRWSATRRCAIAGRSAARSRTATPPRTRRRCCSRSTPSSSRAGPDGERRAAGRRELRRLPRRPRSARRRC